ncbi:hypothetical protein [Microbacterium sp. CJ88]|uniref:hypothetical protein n=1 Tax=Microbacterium sp. CJ88 TaxID=3445672 RepID=UPI003F65AFC1
MAVFLLGDAVLRAGWGQMLLLAPWVLLVLWGIYVTMFASMIQTDASGATVQNYLRRTRVPWSVVTDIRLRYQVVLVLGDGEGAKQLRAFGGPVAGRPGRPRRADADRAHREPPALREVELIRDQWQSAVGSDARGGVATRSWDLPATGVLVGLVVWAVVAVLITGGPS